MAYKSAKIITGPLGEGKIGVLRLVLRLFEIVRTTEKARCLEVYFI